MAEYIFRYDVIENWSASFSADSREHAEELYRQVVEGDLNPQDLPDFYEKNSGVDNYYYELENGFGSDRND